MDSWNSIDTYIVLQESLIMRVYYTYQANRNNENLLKFVAFP